MNQLCKCGYQFELVNYDSFLKEGFLICNQCKEQFILSFPLPEPKIEQPYNERIKRILYQISFKSD